MKKGYWIGGVLIVLCMLTGAYSLRWGVPTDLLAEARASQETSLIYGKLLKDSVNISQGMTRAKFRLEERTTRQTINVIYDNPSSPVSANFANATDVIVRG